jgi:hypothetical protein
MTWSAAETNKHQDHVVAHVIGATPLRYLVHDETAYVLLDIGFVWNIYLDLEMGLVPQVMALSELGVDEESFQAADVECGPIESVEVFEEGQEKRLVLNCEHSAWVIETSLSHGWIRVHPWLK